ncbi:MAG: SAM-dependent methyltransferase [Acidimicrobiales bacterium]
MAADEVEPSMERFDRYMTRCLYGPGGFYATTGTAGRRRGDFITSPEVGPLFGAVLAEAIDGWWDEIGRPDPLPIYDVGCGPGTLLKSIAVARPDRPWRYIGVDVVDAAGASRRELPDDLSGAVVLANELLDNLPFRIVERGAEGLLEVFVDNGREVLRPSALELELPIGARAPMLEAADRWIRRTLAANPARLCLFDYGAATTAELARRGGWLRTYRNHRRGSDPFVDPGSTDITTDVAWDQLPTPAEPLVHQAEFLRRWGIERLVDEGRRWWSEHAAAPDLAALRMRSRISEAEALLDPSGLGGWWVAVW